MDDLFVPVQTLTRMNGLSEKLGALGYSSINRWTGETFDHESNPSAQFEDIEKLVHIAESGERLAKTPEQRYLTKLLKDTALVYVETTRRAINDKQLSSTEVREIVIGEGNLRVVATK